jgi:hypothetical protein
MIFRQYTTLGLLPAILVFLFLTASVTTLGYVLFKVSYRDPVIAVPEAVGVGHLQPAVADETYIRAFATNFLAQWATWNEYTYQRRRSLAIGMMTPVVRGTFAAQAARSSDLMASLRQSQSLILQSLIVTPLDSEQQFFQVSFEGNLRVFYGGVGGDLDPYAGSLLLRSIPPSSENPLCLEVYGFKLARATINEVPPS